MPLKYSFKRTIPLFAFAQLILGQSNDASPAQLDEMLTRFRQNDYNPGTIAVIERSGEQRAIPVLKEAFAKASSGLNKAAIARGLVRLGVQDEMYWAVLSERAKQAISSKAPSVFANTPTAGGNASPSYSAAFVAWATANGLDPDKAAYDQMYTLPGDVMMMAITGDPRGIPILRQGLSSSNYGVRNAALVGLALIQDKDSIPAMIQAANNAPPGMRDLLARPLVFFDDPRAQTASQEMIKDKRVLQEMQETARTKGPRGEWR